MNLSNQVTFLNRLDVNYDRIPTIEIPARSFRPSLFFSCRQKNFNFLQSNVLHIIQLNFSFWYKEKSTDSHLMWKIRSSHWPSVWWSKYYFNRLKIKQLVAGLDLGTQNYFCKVIKKLKNQLKGFLQRILQKLWKK